MLRLFIDQGNTRIKWRLVHGDSWKDCATQIGGLEDFSNWLRTAINDRTVTRDIAISVSAVSGRSALADLFHRLGLENVIYHSSKARCRGLNNSYTSPEKMGVDRWLAMLACHIDNPIMNWIVVDAGTAVTIDVVAAGVHQGGYILPGIQMSMKALYGTTENIIAGDDLLGVGVEGVLGKNTRQCVELGVVNQLLAIIVQVQQDFPTAKLVFTGGDAKQLSPSFKEVLVDEDLVLRGMYLIG